jgi:hypothetical protein
VDGQLDYLAGVVMGSFYWGVVIAMLILPKPWTRDE